jgi:hypothetical protein
MPKTKTSKKTQKTRKAKPSVSTVTRKAVPAPATQPAAAADRQTRRFVRIEVSSPVSFVPFRLPLAGPVDVSQICNGRVLNISGGGLLLETSAWVEPSDYLLLRIGLFENCHLERVVGRVKRMESTGSGECLLGIEFLTREMLHQLVAELPNGYLPSESGAFDEKLRELLSKQIFAKKSSSGLEGAGR